jgi:hypothetical protein
MHLGRKSRETAWNAMPGQKHQRAFGNDQSALLSSPRKRTPVPPGPEGTHWYSQAPRANQRLAGSGTPDTRPACVSMPEGPKARNREAVVLMQARLASSGPKGRKRLAGGVSPRNTPPQSGSPEGAPVAPDGNLSRPFRASWSSGACAPGVHPRLYAGRPSGYLPAILA